MNKPPLAVSAAVYHADQVADQPTLSKSILHLLLTASPAHARQAHPRLNPDWVKHEEQKFDIGTSVHDLFLEGGDRLEIIVADSWRTKAAQEQRDIARADNRIPLLVGQAQEVQAMCAALKEQLATVDLAPPLFAQGKPEQTIVWHDRGVLCRARLDWLHDDYSAIDDLKTSSRFANPEQWCKSTLWSIGADVQAEFYSRGLESLTGRRPDFRFVVVETAPPYGVSVIGLGPDVMTLAAKKVDWALDLWRKCLANNDWPGYPTRVAYAELPPWIEAAWLAKELRTVPV